MVQRWAGSAAFLRNLPPIGVATSVVILLASIVGSLTYPKEIAYEGRKANAFVVDGGGLSPDWLHLRKTGTIFLKNSCSGPNTVVLNGTELPSLAPCEEREIALAERGIHQFYARSPSFRSHSSFVLVDPVAQATVRKP